MIAIGSNRMKLLCTLTTGILLYGGCDAFTPGTGSVAISLTDAPIDDAAVSAVYITITEIHYHRDGRWHVAEAFSGPQRIDLLELTGGRSTLLAVLDLPAGAYTQIRFRLEVAQHGATTSPGSYLLFDDAATPADESDDRVEPLFAPSAAQRGYTAVGEFTVPWTGETAITADFDVRKAVVETGNGQYLLKPTIRLVVDELTGSIRGLVGNGTAYADLFLFAYSDGDSDSSEADAPNAGETRFPGAVTSGGLDPDGTYHLGHLPEGTYDLVVAGADGATFGEVLAVVEDVAVEPAGDTVVDVSVP